jgi:hypothetical protein
MPIHARRRARHAVVAVAGRTAGGDYHSLPWRLGLLTQTNSTC